ncbi:condensation domain-containing protein [Chitinophaga sp. HK235]|uniref:condensation domain-containing protein n=1 Tax=Chitinophaga sp. HK235 TaxID=2952571 RepID=UPI001BA545D5|nr:condensation domain-containing protein [Chitinophaga sp. HK235]
MENVWPGASEPSIGQVEYLKYLQVMSTVQKPSYVQVELELPQLNKEVVSKTIRLLLDRHNGLRTIFPMQDNRIVQVVLPVGDSRFQMEVVKTGKEVANFHHIRKDVYDKASAVFSDIGNGPLVCAVLFDNGSDGLLSLLIHHVICDEWSCILIRNELKIIHEAFTAGKEPQLPPVQVQLKNYCEKQNTWLRDNQQEISFFWKRKLSGFDKFFDIAVYRKMYNRRRNVLFPVFTRRHSYKTSELGAILDRPEASSYTSVIWHPAFSETATGSGKSVDSSVYASLLLFLYAYTGKKKLLVPSLVTDRLEPSYQQLVGCLLGSIYLAVDIQEDMTVRAFEQLVKNELAAACRHIIFSHNFLDLDGDLIRNCCDMYVNYLRKPGNMPAQVRSHKHVEEDYAINYPVYCLITVYDDALVFVWKYNRFLFDSNMIEDMVRYYEMLVQYIAHNEELPISELKNLVSIPEIIL